MLLFENKCIYLLHNLNKGIKNMEITNLLKSIEAMKEHGDAVRIARMVNEKRVARGEKKISQAYVSYMLKGERKMTEEVAIEAEKYYKAQEQLKNECL